MILLFPRPDCVLKRAYRTDMAGQLRTNLMFQSRAGTIGTAAGKLLVIGGKRDSGNSPPSDLLRRNHLLLVIADDRDSRCRFPGSR